MTSSNIPNLRIVVGTCIAALSGYAVFSFYAVVVLKDPTMTGDVVGTWKSFAVAAVMFWIGSSSGGKEKKESPAGTDTDPLSVDVGNTERNPVPTTTEPPPGSSTR